MIQMTINSSTTFPINGYSRYTDVQDSKVYSSANVSMTGNEVYDTLIGLCSETISSIAIENDGKLVYSITNQNGRISNISESLDGDIIRLNMNIAFSVREDNSDTESI